LRAEQCWRSGNSLVSILHLRIALLGCFSFTNDLLRNTALLGFRRSIVVVVVGRAVLNFTVRSNRRGLDSVYVSETWVFLQCPKLTDGGAEILDGTSDNPSLDGLAFTGIDDVFVGAGVVLAGTCIVSRRPSVVVFAGACVVFVGTGVIVFAGTCNVFAEKCAFFILILTLPLNGV
jgi:hypothetical protein